ncbi:DsbA family protein [Zafaria sp. Z1313]|uniref:DsbA family protein n=1 Tax=Zafaria sp. Z1313 TaxID=3423202 RepID=UPI003D3032E1
MAANGPRPTKVQRTADAREQARRMAEQRAASEKRKSLLVKLGVVAAVVVIIAIVAAIVIQNRVNEVADSGPIPAGGNEHGGITLVSDTAVADTAGGTADTTALPPLPDEQGAPDPSGLDADADPTQIVLYVDVNCVHCADFEGAFGEQLKTWAASGEATVEYRNVAFLDRSSPTNYSSRGANALACVAQEAPASYFSFAQAVFAHHSEGEMSNNELTQLARDNGAEIESCVKDGTFRPFVAQTTHLAQVEQIPGTPSVWVAGQVWDPNAEPDFQAWAQGLIDG